MPRAGLTPALVVESATRIADASGLSALTLAAVAGEVGVRTPSLYKHVDGLPSLRRLVGVRAKRELAAVLEDGEASTAVTDVVFAALRGYGLSDDALVDATRTLRAVLVGFAALEASGGFGMARPVDESFDWWLDSFDTALSAG